jgi:uncharacterized membrane protein YfcA
LDPTHALILAAAGVSGGFVAGLVGVGGGIIFAPVLFFFFQSTGVPDLVVAPLTIGTSLFCTTVASSVSAWQHSRKSAVMWPVAVRVGLLSFVVLFLVVRFVTTEPWFDKRAFEVVFATVLLVVSTRMGLLRADRTAGDSAAEGGNRSASPILLASIGSAAGAIAASAGVGGGVILVPSYHQFLRMKMTKAVGTSSGTIILISGLGVLTYGLSPADVSAFLTIGHVDLLHGLILAVPAMLTSSLGAMAAHRIDRVVLRRAFAFFAAIVALKMLFG